MGKGDRKSKRGKIILGTFGKVRHRKRTVRPTPKPSTIKEQKSI